MTIISKWLINDYDLEMTIMSMALKCQSDYIVQETGKLKRLENQKTKTYKWL